MAGEYFFRKLLRKEGNEWGGLETRRYSGNQTKYPRSMDSFTDPKWCHFSLVILWVSLDFFQRSVDVIKEFEYSEHSAYSHKEDSNGKYEAIEGTDVGSWYLSVTTLAWYGNCSFLQRLQCKRFLIMTGLLWFGYQSVFLRSGALYRPFDIPKSAQCRSLWPIRSGHMMVYADLLLAKTLREGFEKV